ncbi:MAG: hypothetical protein CL726_01155 [Chloroflexi bacterium]|nr:hypothetical protein [Chloroflexota bacterium]
MLLHETCSGNKGGTAGYIPRPLKQFHLGVRFFCAHFSVDRPAGDDKDEQGDQNLDDKLAKHAGLNRE